MQRDVKTEQTIAWAHSIIKGVVTFGWNALLDLSDWAVTKMLSSLMVELLLQILGQSARAVAIWVIHGDEGIGDILGVRGVQGVCRFCATVDLIDTRTQT